MRNLFLLLLCVTCTISLAQNISKDQLTIQTKNSSLVMIIHNNKLLQAYYGDRLANSQDFLKYRIEDLDNSNKYNVEEMYPTFGNGNYSITALQVTHSDGNLTTDLVYDSYKSSVNGNITEWEIHLKDSFYPLLVIIKIKSYYEEDVIEQSVELINNESGDVVIKNASSMYLNLNSESYYLTHFDGSWAKEMNMTEERLTNGIKVISSNKGVRTAQTENPSFILSLDHEADEDFGKVYAGALAWSGNYKFQFQIDRTSDLHITSGLNDEAADYVLPKGNAFSTPRMVITFSGNGKGQASRNLHDWSRNYNLQDGDEVRPIVLNSWEGAYFNFDEKTITDMITDAAGMGIEMFVLDDGWFGNKYPRNSDNAGLGDWQVNKEKLPNGLGLFINQAKKEGIKFGIWVEPEMVNPKSELAENHPEWIVQSLNREKTELRNQLILDLSNPEVQKFVFNSVNNILNENRGIAYVKWDANRHVEYVGSTYLPENRQSHFWVEYVKGLYSVYEKLIFQHPDVIFQACASGGGRLDYGALAYHHEFWASDNTDALSRIFIQWGTNQIYPAIATASHVSTSPNHQTGRIIPLKFRFDVAITGRLGIELQPKQLTSEEKEFARNCIENYRTIVRPLVQLGDLYRGISPYGNTGRTSLCYVSKTKKAGVLFAYSIDHHKLTENINYKFKGLDPDKVYMLKELNVWQNSNFPYNNKEFTGAFLMQFGLELPLSRPYTSMVIHAESN